MPTAVKGVEIPKKNGKKRLLGVPTIADRVAQMVVRMNFEPLVENRAAADAIGITRQRFWKIFPFLCKVMIFRAGWNCFQNRGSKYS